ncbi:hypothetical protein [uncultured Adlercreutzia sp.]|uniref:hypothetical protein n=1 Tax=uncultured Adlercreutzia sp. TaxID=875803 RepID=UPI0025E6FBED|nr:hypothetical protein [uncultured Adlercreutzia sp.]
MRCDSAYLFLGGSLYWRSKDGLAVANAPQGTLELTFNSMSLPHLNPQISSIKLYRLNQATGKFDILVQPTDELDDDEVVQAVCTVINANASSAASGYSERFNMHLKLADTAENPTRGIAPFADAAHPLQVDGKTVATAPGDNTLTGANGVPLTLVGTTPVEVSYYAKVNQGSAAVSVSHELIEDSFQGSQFKTVELLPKRALVPGDPGDPTLKPGTDYHYTRLPAANENGWNGIATSPVDVTFYAGDFDRFTVTGAGGSALGTLAGGQKWTQSADIDALLVTYQAKNTVSEALSTTGEDIIRIDTQAPSLSHDAATGALTANDTGAAGKATSGIWKVERVKAGGRPFSAEDITPQASTAAEPLIPGGTSAATAYADEQTSWDFPIADGKGAATQTVAGAQPGFYVATDAAGNRSAVFEVKEPETPVDPGPDDPTPPVDPTPDDPNKPGPGDGDDDPNNPAPDTPDNPDNPGGNPKPPTTDDPAPDTPGTTDPTFPAITPKPTDEQPSPTPLAPTKTERDPVTGLTHAWMEDSLTLPCSSKPVSPAMMATLIAERYTVGAGLTSANISAGAVRLLDAEGNAVDAIDRAAPGTWYAEQTFTDAQGNRTTLRLTITVREDSASGSLTNTGSGSSQGGGSGNGSANGNGTAGDTRTNFTAALTDLPQTGGILGPCPMHILFVLLALMSTAYSLMRLRQCRTSADAQRQGHGPCPTEGVGADSFARIGRQKRAEALACDAATFVERQGHGPCPTEATEEFSGGGSVRRERGRYHYHAFDALVHFVIIDGALILAWLTFCPLDYLYAAGVIALTLFWAWRLSRNPQQTPRFCQATEKV